MITLDTLRGMSDELDKVAAARWQKELLKDPDTIMQAMTNRAGVSTAPSTGFLGKYKDKLQAFGDRVRQILPHAAMGNETGVMRSLENPNAPLLHKVREGLRTNVEDSADMAKSIALRRKINERKFDQMAKNAPVPIQGGNPLFRLMGAGETRSYPGGRSEIVVERPKFDLTAAIADRTNSVLSALQRKIPGRKHTTDVATLAHELGEYEITKGRGPMIPHASHLGTRPILKEDLEHYNDPVAHKVMKSWRDHHPDDLKMKRLMTSMGATPGAPMPLDGRQHRALDKALNEYVQKNPVRREHAMDDLKVYKRMGFPVVPPKY